MAKNFTSGVYFIQNKGNGLIKIGCSKDIDRRCRDLKAQNEHLGYVSQLILLDKIIVDNYYDLEQYIHNRFSENRVINEWFNITVEDIKNIKLEMKDISYRSFDSGYIKTDISAVDEFKEKGLNYSDIGIVFHLKDYINNENALCIDEKFMNQNDIINVLKLDRKSVYLKMKILKENKIIIHIPNPDKKRDNIYIVNPKYFRSSNYNGNVEYEKMF